MFPSTHALTIVSPRLSCMCVHHAVPGSNGLKLFLEQSPFIITLARRLGAGASVNSDQAVLLVRTYRSVLGQKETKRLSRESVWIVSETGRSNAQRHLL